MNKKVLVVDNNASVKEIISLIIRDLGYNVFLAENWGEAIDILQKDDFNVLFTDFWMPAMRGIKNGIELIRSIKRNQFNPRMKIILMSGDIIEDENDSIKKMAWAAGADIVVNKSEICKIDVMRQLLKNLWIYF